MRRHIGLLSACLVLASACQLQAGVSPKATARAVSPSSLVGVATQVDNPAKTGTPVPSSTPGGVATPGPALVTSTPAGLAATAGPTVAPGDGLADPQKLLKPTGASTLLSGLATLDASYLVTAGGGNVISHNGSAIVAAGGGNVISHNGSAMISNNGSAIVAAGGGNVISHNGSAIVAAGGGNVIAEGGLNLVALGGGNLVPEGGGSLVASGGGSVISHNGSSIVAAGGGNYGLLGLSPGFHLADAAGTSATSPAPLIAGTTMPAVGLRISVLSLDTNTPVPIGQDAKGQPVYTVYTNEEGKYELYLPAAQQGNVRVVANVRDGSTSDNPLEDPNPRFRYDIVHPTGTDVNVDEDLAVVSQYILDGFTSRIVPILSFPITDFQAFEDDHFGTLNHIPGGNQILKPLILELNQDAIDAHIPDAPPAYINQLARRFIAQVVKNIDLNSVVIDNQTSKFYVPSTPEPAMVALTQCFSQARSHLESFLPPKGNLETEPFFLDAQCNQLIPSDFHFKKGSDIGTFVVSAYLGRDGYLWGNIANLLKIIKADDLPADIHTDKNNDQADRIEAAAQAILEQIMVTIAINPDLHDQLQHLIQAHAYSGPKAPLQTPVPTCAPTASVGATPAP